jgi:GT2 family glycosyltransferase
MIEIVAATRASQADFRTSTPLGLSLSRLARDQRLIPFITFSNTSPNTQGLPVVYNQRIQASKPENDYLLFIHDDVRIDDFFVADHIIRGLSQYDIVGVAGNRRRVPNQPAWAFIDDQFTCDTENLTGSVAHGATPFGVVSRFGSVPAECELLDGVFLAARRSTLVGKGVSFDAQFDFHFYDMDFCRTARVNGLKLGTWHISIAHTSGGAFGTPDWRAKLSLYRQKWKDEENPKAPLMFTAQKL